MNPKRGPVTHARGGWETRHRRSCFGRIRPRVGVPQLEKHGRELLVGYDACPRLEGRNGVRADVGTIRGCVVRLGAPFRPYGKDRLPFGPELSFSVAVSTLRPPR